MFQEYQLSLFLWHWEFRPLPSSTKKKNKVSRVEKKIDSKVVLKRSSQAIPFFFRSIKIFIFLFVHPKSYVYIEGASLETPDLTGRLFAIYQNMAPKWIVWNLDFQKEFKLDKMQLSMMVLPISTMIFLLYLLLTFPYRLWWAKD